MRITATQTKPEIPGVPAPVQLSPALELSPAAPPIEPVPGGGPAGLRFLGRGRSGFVYLGRDPAGNRVACKVFDAQSVTRLVQCVLLGSPNPYVWNEDAVVCAVLRRRILTQLVRHWFGEELGVANARGYTWNAEHRAFELVTEFTPGRPVPLAHGVPAPEGLKTLQRRIMRPLQARLIESGFVGLAWQAGLGNPVALNNFLRESSGRFVWIDLESGIPAVVPANPLKLFGFYLPEALRRGRPLFDDVDADVLLRYLAAEAEALTANLGATRFASLHADAVALIEHQAAWKTVPWSWRGIGYQVARGRLSPAEAEAYRQARVRWAGRQVCGAAGVGVRGLIGALRGGWRALCAIRWRALPRVAGLLWTSHRFRTGLAEGYVRRRVFAWRRRGHIDAAQARFLRRRLQAESVSGYLGDFGAHLALKPLVKVIEYGVLPLCWSCGMFGGWALAGGMLACGTVARSLYTSVRGVQDVRQGRPFPWVALGLGAVPVAGNFAYPGQITYSAKGRDAALGRFLLFDAGARVGAAVPIWGGADTATEHFGNRAAGVLVGRKCRAAKNGESEDR